MDCWRGGIRHDESGAALFVQRGVEMLDPEVVAIVGARDAEGVARISGEAFLVDLADIEGRIYPPFGTICGMASRE